MPRRPARDVMVGTFATLALLVLAVAVMTVGGESRLFRGVAYRVSFPNTDGLRAGSPVRMAGVEVGSVREVRLPTDPASAGIDVVLSVGKPYAARVREDSKAALRYLQVLSGEKYVEITPGSPGRSVLREGSAILRNEEPEFFEQGADIASNINEITLSLKNILGPLERGEGLLGEMLHDPNFGRVGLAALRDSLENLEALTGRLRSGEGVAGRLLYDKELARRVDDFSRSLSHMADTMDAVSRREGVVGALLNEGGSGQKAIEDVHAAAASLRRTAERLESTDGLFGKLLNDREYSAEVARDLKSVFHDLAAITGKINAGQGTLGALVNERTLHDSMEDVVAGVNDSGFARWLLRHYQKKGIKKEDQVAEPPEKAP